jgi:hypothetical protein
MHALCMLCKSLLTYFTSSTVKSTHSLLISAPLKMGGGGFHSRRNCRPQSPFRNVDRGVFLKSYLWAKPDHRGRKNERRSCFALAPSLDRRTGALKIIAAPSTRSGQASKIRRSISSGIWAYRPAPRRVRRRVESIYSKRSEEPKTASQRKPTAAARSNSEPAAP